VGPETGVREAPRSLCEKQPWRAAGAPGSLTYARTGRQAVKERHASSVGDARPPGALAQPRVISVRLRACDEVSAASAGEKATR